MMTPRLLLLLLTQTLLALGTEGAVILQSGNKTISASRPTADDPAFHKDQREW